MIDRRTKNAEIFCDTERRYTTDQALVHAVRQSTETQVFIAEKATVSVSAPSKTEKAKVIVSGKRSLEAAESYAKQGMGTTADIYSHLDANVKSEAGRAIESVLSINTEDTE